MPETECKAHLLVREEINPRLKPKRFFHCTGAENCPLALIESGQSSILVNNSPSHQQLEFPTTNIVAVNVYDRKCEKAYWSIDIKSEGSWESSPSRPLRQAVIAVRNLLRE